MTHMPPRGILDTGVQVDGLPVPTGSQPIQRMVRRKQPFLQVFGHVHSQFGHLDRFMNAAFKTSRQFVDIDTRGPTVKFLETGLRDSAW